MQPKTVLALNRLNREFYRTRAAVFAAKRDHVWPGWLRLLAELPTPPRSVLDVGCGNGRFGALLARRLPDTRYVGIDASPELLAECERRLPQLPSDTEIVQGDFIEEPGCLPAGPFDAVVLFGVLHHVPGRGRRGALLDELASRVRPGGSLVATRWRFGDFKRFDNLRLSWSGTDVDRSELEPGDTLLEFDGGEVPRYCHHVDGAEADGLATSLSLPCVLRFRADGREGELNEYMIWRAAG